MNKDLVDLLGKAAQADCLRIFLDYDGTLAEFAPTPDTILPDDSLIELMRRLVRCRGVLPAVISGRRLAHIQKLLPVSGLFLAGTYGIEMQLPDGSILNALDFEKVRPVIAPVLTYWKNLIGNSASVYIEDKGWAAAFHKNVAGSEDSGLTLLQLAKRTKEIIPSCGYRLAGNDRFLEVSPEKANKAEAIRTIKDRYTPKNAMLLFFGDDEKDEEAFHSLMQEGGDAIRVSKEPVETRAKFLMDHPDEVRSWLQQLVSLREHL